LAADTFCVTLIPAFLSAKCLVKTKKMNQPEELVSPTVSPLTPVKPVVSVEGIGKPKVPQDPVATNSTLRAELSQVSVCCIS
jgi:hypothetical protein